MLAYKDVVESFFDRNYPALEKDKFWKWILLMLTGKDQDINNLSSDELNKFLAKLKELGTVLLDPKIYEGLTKSGGL
jgi:hypothetical protein